ncbi:MAG: DUF5305 domain-containing protein, partial [Halapricum sp.]
MGSRDLRVRAVVDQYFNLVALGFVVLVIVGGFVAYGAYTQPDERTETVSDTEVTWTTTGEFDHEATVIEDTRVFDAGETLTNRTEYYRQIAPELDGAFAYSYSARNGSLSANTSVALVMRSVSEEGKEYWRVTERLNGTNRTIASGEPLRVAFSQNITAVEVELNQIRSELGTTAGTTEAFFEATVRVRGDRNGESVDTTRSYRLPFTIESDLYRVNDSGPVVDQGERTVTEEISEPVTVSPVRSYGGPLLALIGLGGIVGLAVGRSRDWFEVSDREREYLTYRSHRNEFDEWITEARLPSERIADAEDRIETTSLAGLVDLAIDIDRRVLETPEHDRYV